MEMQKLWPLAAILVVLLAIGVLKNQKPTRRRLSEQAGLKSLSPANFLVSDIERVTITMAGKEKPAVALKRLNDKDWTVESLYEVPADTLKVEGFIEKLKKLEGEFRAKKKEVIKDFALDDKQAKRLVCYKKSESKPYLTILIGKKASSKETFVRLPGNDTVYSVAVNFRSELGIFGDDEQKAPEGKHFMKKRFVTVDGPKVTQLTMFYPNKELRFEKREKPKASIDESKMTTAEIEAHKNKPAEFQWHLVEGPKAMGFKEDGLKEAIKNFDSLDAEGAMDPTTPSKWGLDNPGYKAEITLEDSKKIVLFAHKTESEAYVRLDGKPHIYKVSSWNFDKAFPKGSKLFTMPTVSIKHDDLAKIAVTKGESHFVIERKDVAGTKKWVLTEPLVVEAEESKLSDIGWGVSGISLDDYADMHDPRALGLMPPVGTITYTLNSGESKTIKVGNVTADGGGRLVQLPSQKGAFVVTKYNIDRAFKSIDDIKKTKTEEPK